MGPSPFIDPLLSEKELTEDEYMLRKAFVDEYMKHRNAYRACVAIGFMEVYAQDWAKAFMGEGLVRRLINEAERTEDCEEAALERRYKYRALMETEATYYGPGSSHGARVTAISNLMKMEGMEAPVKTETEVTYKGGVMIVPALSSPDEWGALAAKSQADLKQNVKE